MGIASTYRTMMIGAAAVVSLLLAGSNSFAGVIFTSEARSVSNTFDSNNPPSFSSTTTNSTGNFEHFVVSGTASQDSAFNLVSNVWHLVVHGSHNPTAIVGMTTHTYAYGSTIVNTAFDVSGTEQYTYTPLSAQGPTGITPVITGPNGQISLTNGVASSGTLPAGHYTLVSQIIGHQGDNISTGFHYDLALTPEPASGFIAFAGAAVLALTSRRRRAQ